MLRRREERKEEEEETGAQKSVLLPPTPPPKMPSCKLQIETLMARIDGQHIYLRDIILVTAFFLLV